MIPVGALVEHSWRGLGPCTVIGYGKTLLEWPAVFVRDKDGGEHAVSEVYLTILQGGLANGLV